PRASTRHAVGLGLHLQDGISAAKARRNSLQAAVSDLDNRIASIKRERQGRDMGDRIKLERDVRSLNDQRNTAVELLSAAEEQYAKKLSEYDDATAMAVKDLGKIAAACSAAAGRFDRALRDALVALDDIEREALPLANTLIPNGVRRVYTHPRCINAAIALALESRLGRSVTHVPKPSMADCIGNMISEARDSAAQLRNKAAA
ncbi:hypothetical protein, partial [Polymorphobacter multimanifer]